MTHRGTLLTLAMALLMSGPVTAQFVLVNLDGPGEGFNDATARTSDIDGQPTTLGQDRLDCFVAALDTLATHLNVTINIRVGAEFNNLGGNATFAPLGQAGPTTIWRDWSLPATPPPVPLTWFAVAEANQLAGSDRDPGVDDISAEFNLEVDTTCPTCPLGLTTWYYGIDGNPPPGKIDFFAVVLHEVMHGLGFLSFMDPFTGGLAAGFIDIFTEQLRDNGVINLDYSAMNDAERASANIAGEVFWKGAAVVVENSGLALMYAPNPIEPGSSISHWDTTHFPNLLMEPLATDAFTDLTLERWALDDMFWPVLSALDRNNVFVQFSFMGPEFGTLTNPFIKAVDALAEANLDATIHFAGEATTETGTFSQKSTWVTTGGTVRIGGL